MFCGFAVGALCALGAFFNFFITFARNSCDFVGAFAVEAFDFVPPVAAFPAPIASTNFDISALGGAAAAFAAFAAAASSRSLLLSS